MSELEIGWYVNPSNFRRERYWNGEKWLGNRRREPTTPYVPGHEHEPGYGASVFAAKSPGAWSVVAGWMNFIGVLAVLGAVVGGVALLVAKGQNCSSNPYNGTLQTCVDTHPFTLTGVAVLVGGVLQAAVIFTVAALCTT